MPKNHEAAGSNPAESMKFHVLEAGSNPFSASSGILAGAVLDQTSPLDEGWSPESSADFLAAFFAAGVLS